MNYIQITSNITWSTASTMILWRRICLQCKRGDVVLIPGWGRLPEGGNGYPRQYSFLENPMDRGAWWATVHRVTNSQT